MRSLLAAILPPLNTQELIFGNCSWAGCRLAPAWRAISAAAQLRRQIHHGWRHHHGSAKQIRHGLMLHVDSHWDRWTSATRPVFRQNNVRLTRHINNTMCHQATVVLRTSSAAVYHPRVDVNGCCMLFHVHIHMYTCIVDASIFRLCRFCGKTLSWDLFGTAWKSCVLSFSSRTAIITVLVGNPLTFLVQSLLSIISHHSLPLSIIDPFLWLLTAVKHNMSPF